MTDDEYAAVQSRHRAFVVARARFDAAVTTRDGPTAEAAIVDMRRVVADMEADALGDDARWTLADDLAARSSSSWGSPES